MAIGDAYITVDELKSYIQFEEHFASRDSELEAAAMAASEKVEQCCDRQFNRADVASTRLYRPTQGGRLLVDDFWTTDDLVVELDGQVWSQVVLHPVNGTMNGRPGWPFYEIRPGRSEPSFPQGYEVEVTAKWGWSEVPGPVVAATKVLAAQLFKLSDAPLGVAGFSQFGAAIRVRDMPPQVKMLLAPYDKHRALVG